MDKIKKLHLDVISHCLIYSEEFNEIEGKEYASSKSANITRQIAVEFFDWVDKLIRKGEIVNKNNASFYYKNSYYISPELFEEFLKIK